MPKSLLGFDARFQARGLLLAGGILFVIGFGAPCLLRPHLGGAERASCSLGAPA